MKIIGLPRLQQYCLKHPDCRKWIANWISDVGSNKWSNTHDVGVKYSTASFLANNIVIFNVKGNRYRLETQIAYQVGTLAVLWIGSHAEYNKRHQ